MSEYCLLNPAGHRLFMSKSYENYEPYTVDKYGTLYRRKEFAILSCNCGEIIRKQVKDD